MSCSVAPIEEEEVAGPNHGLAKKAAAAAALGALLGSALVLATHKASSGTLWATASTPSALWETQFHEGGSQWHEQGNLGNQQWQQQGHVGGNAGNQQMGNLQWHAHHQDKVACGGGECTCAWASAEQCSRKDSPQTQCWNCCCREKFPENYRWAMHQRRSHFGHEQTPVREEGQFNRGDDVNVQSAHGNWHPATVLNRISQGRYQVQYDMSRRVEIVRSDQMVDGVWTPWWVWVFWVLLVACMIMCVVGLLAFLRGKKKVRGDDELIEEQPIFRDSAQDRTCGRACS